MPRFKFMREYKKNFGVPTIAVHPNDQKIRLGPSKTYAVTSRRS
jgi:hypothetical protein